ncbi:MAG: hypothetical protein IT384_34145 [Deltaproteobacteria bacterium]|nr:hypothetical protein [Deltaproteobacteria bacterium]
MNPTPTNRPPANSRTAIAQAATPIAVSSELQAAVSGIAKQDIEVNATMTAESLKISAGQAVHTVSVAREMSPLEQDAFAQAPGSVRAELSLAHDVTATVPLTIEGVLQLVQTISARLEGKPLSAEIRLAGGTPTTPTPPQPV